MFKLIKNNLKQKRKKQKRKIKSISPFDFFRFKKKSKKKNSKKIKKKLNRKNQKEINKKTRRLTQKRKKQKNILFKKIQEIFSKINFLFVGFFVTGFVIVGIGIFLLKIETNEHIKKLHFLNMKAEIGSEILNKDFRMLESGNLDTDGKKRLFRNIRELDEVALRIRYELEAYQNDWSVNFLVGDSNPISQSFLKARETELYINRLNRSLEFVVFLNNSRLFETSLIHKNFELLQKHLIEVNKGLKLK